MSVYQWTVIVFLVFALVLIAIKAWNRDTRGAFTIGGGVVLLGMLLIVSGCAASPERQAYMEVGLAYDTQHTMGKNPACIVRIRQPIGFWKIPPEWLLIGYEHHSSCPDQHDRNTVDQFEIVAKIPLGRRR